jgi:uncharacterized Zn finger protein
VTASMLCPRCGQGQVVIKRVHSTGEVIRICDECEAVWPAGIDIGVERFIQFDRYMSERGLDAEWNLLYDARR